MRCTETLLGHVGAVSSLDLLNKGRPLSGGDDKTVRFWKAWISMDFNGFEWISGLEMDGNAMRRRWTRGRTSCFRGTAMPWTPCAWQIKIALSPGARSLWARL